MAADRAPSSDWARNHWPSNRLVSDRLVEERTGNANQSPATTAIPAPAIAHGDGRLALRLEGKTDPAGLSATTSKSSPALPAGNSGPSPSTLSPEVAAVDAHHRYFVSHPRPLSVAGGSNIVGAGPTGVELGGQIRHLAAMSLRNEFRAFESASARAILLDGGKEPLATFGDRLAGKATSELEHLDVELTWAHVS
jgi:hypothetical protein